ncbi:MAG TPA: CARDB domain-containing protein [Bacteroidales bacterium]|nr:CARDB domain-containing protein [Bacteroidales bacterium]HSA43741.1 CARDB domain-containing protein [Bacteroidales bacterium]
MKKIILIILIALFAGKQTHAQPAVIRIDTMITGQIQEMLVPVYFSNFSNVGSITLYISFVQSFSYFHGAVNWHSAFDNGFNFANAYGDVIAISCLNYAGVTAAEGKLLDLKITTMFPIVNLSFLAGCEITDVNGLPLTPPPVFSSGAICRPLTIAANATKTSVCEEDSTRLSVQASGLFGNFQYQWFSDPPGFTSTLPNPWVVPSQSTRYTVSVSSGTISDTASVMITMVDPPQPAQVSILHPEPDTGGLLNPVTFSWNPAAGATHYEIYHWKQGDTEPVQAAASGEGMLNFTPTYPLKEGSTHLWRVNALNACKSTPGQVNQFSMLPLPELHITQVQVSQPAAGQVLQVSWTVKNDGLGPTTSPLWYDRVWLTPDLACYDEDWAIQLLGQYPNVSSLNPGESYTQTKTFILPENIYGNYFLFFLTDAPDAMDIEFNGPPIVPYNPPPHLMARSYTRPLFNLVKEANEEPLPFNYYQHDNFFYHPIFLTVPPVPDLSVTQIIKPGSAFSGQAVNITYTITNQGEVSPYVQSWVDNIYISHDTILNPATAFLLHTESRSSSLAPDSTYTVNLSTTLPPELSGKYFIYVFTDANQQVFEYVFDGNNILRSDTITVYLTPPPDLQVTDIQHAPTATAGSNITLKYTVSNEGGSTPLAGKWKDVVYLCLSADFHPDEVSFYKILVIQNNGNSPGSGYSKEVGIPIPAGLNGPWYFHVLTDYENDVFEYNMEGNNRACASEAILIVNPDLTAGSFDIPSVDSSDNSMLIQHAVTNLGPGKLQLRRILSRYYLCPEAVFNPSTAVVTAENNHAYSLLPEEFKSLEDECKLPDVNSGYYYLYTEVDADNRIYEPGHENNNIARSNNSIYIRRADLVTSALQLPASVSSGSQMIIKATVKNTGQGIAGDTNMVNRVTLSLMPQANPPLDREILLTYKTCNLAPGDSIIYTDTLIIPPDLTGNWYVSYYTDWLNTVKEGSQGDNNLFTASEPLLITQGPVPDLQFVSLDIQDTLTAGLPFQLGLTSVNAGNQSMFGLNWHHKIYWSSLPDWFDQSVTLLKQIDLQLPLPIDSVNLATASCAFPEHLNDGTYYLHIRLDAGNNIYEGSGENNNAPASLPVHVKPYGLDLTVMSAVTEADTLGMASIISFSYTAANISQVSSIYPDWQDALYASADAFFDPSEDVRIARWFRTGQLQAGNTYTQFKSLRLPANLINNVYLFVVCDDEGVNPDINRNNNSCLVSVNGQPNPLIITAMPYTDFTAVSLQAPAQVYTNRTYPVQWTVKNQGDTLPFDAWKDKIYLSSDQQINTGDILLYTDNRNPFSGFHPGEEYTDSTVLSANPTITGNYWLLFKTDADDTHYEYAGENNNTAEALVFFRQAPPSDLTLSEVTLDLSSQTAAGISWTVINAGNNQLEGNLKDGIYLSNDSLYSNDDLLWFTCERALSLPGGGLQTCDSLLPLPGIAAGTYYLVIRTDINNAYQETNEDNNILISNAIMLDLPELVIGVPEVFPMENLELLYFKLLIPDSLAGETLLLDMKGDSINGINEIYASYGQVPSRIHHQFSHSLSVSGNQHLYIPSLEAGTWYFLVSGTTLPGASQVIRLLASILSFEIRMVDQDRGGSPGPVTVKIYGSKFTPDMNILLLKDSISLSAKSIVFINPTLVLASFALQRVGQGTSFWQPIAMPGGTYDVKAMKADGSIAMLEDGFEIIPFMEPVLLTNIEYPAHVRPYSTFNMSIQCINMGNNDIPVPKRSLLSLSHAAIARVAADLGLQFFDLNLEFREPGGPEDVLRPGASCDLKIFCKTANWGSLEFLLTK